jgi:hypothetical protein
MSTPKRRKATTSIALMAIGTVALVLGLVTLLSGELRGGVTLIALGLVNILTFVWLRRSEDRAHRAGGWYVFSRSYRAAMIVIGVGGVGLAIWIAIALGRRPEAGVASIALAILGIAGLLFLAVGAILNVAVGVRMQQGKMGRFGRWWFPGWRAVVPDDDDASSDAENKNPPSE